MEWIPINEIEKYDLDGKTILVWQHNLSDNECSRFQRGVYYDGMNKHTSFIVIYPATTRAIFKHSSDWIANDLEGDKCQLTHFAIVKPPIK